MSSKKIPETLSGMSSLSGKVQTVLGLVEPSQLGRTLTHEHLTMTFDSFYCPPPPCHEVTSKEPIMMKNLFWIQKNPYSHRENLQLNQELTDVLINEILHGADGTSIKCGVIGEIGCSWPLTDSERKILEATAHAQAQLGCPVIIHPGRNPGAPFQIIRILQEAGADISKTVMSHLDRTIFDKKELLEFAQLGCYLEYDLFGTELLNYQLSPDIDMPDDNKRIRRLKGLCI